MRIPTFIFGVIFLAASMFIFSMSEVDGFGWFYCVVLALLGIALMLMPVVSFYARSAHVKAANKNPIRDSV